MLYSSTTELIRRLNNAGIPRKDYKAISSVAVDVSAVAVFYGDAARWLLSLRDQVEAQGLRIQEVPVPNFGNVEVWVSLPKEVR